jgi:hypothetical protein
MGWLTRTHTNVIRDALVKAGKRAALAERELAWHEKLCDVDERRAERDYSVRRCERLLCHAVAFGVITEIGARRLAGCVYDALASERRWVKRAAYPSDPEGHWQRVEVLTADVAREWERDRWRVAWSQRMFFTDRGRKFQR